MKNKKRIRDRKQEFLYIADATKYALDLIKPEFGEDGFQIRLCKRHFAHYLELKNKWITDEADAQKIADIIAQKVNPKNFSVKVVTKESVLRPADITIMCVIMK